MYAPERHQRILGRARSDGRVDVRDLAEYLDVTPETVRRDLTALARLGAVRRVHGGAVALPTFDVGAPAPAADDHLAAEHERIAARALEELPEGGAIAVDAGSATARLARLLPARLSLTVVTHALPVARLLATRSDVTLHVLGGTVRPRSLAAVGDWIRRSIAEVSVDVAFVCPTGVSATHGLTSAELPEAAVQRCLIGAASRTVVLADHTAFGRSDFAQVAPLSAVDLVVTDSGVADDLAADVEHAGPTVVRA